MAMFGLTPRKALEIQERHVVHYGWLYPGGVEKLRSDVAAKTNLAGLNLDEEYSVIEINRHIPRGGDIESMVLGKDQGGM